VSCAYIYNDIIELRLFPKADTMLSYYRRIVQTSEVSSRLY